MQATVLFSGTDPKSLLIALSTLSTVLCHKTQFRIGNILREKSAMQLIRLTHRVKVTPTGVAVTCAMLLLVAIFGSLSSIGKVASLGKVQHQRTLNHKTKDFRPSVEETPRLDEKSFVPGDVRHLQTGSEDATSCRVGLQSLMRPLQQLWYTNNMPILSSLATVDGVHNILFSMGHIWEIHGREEWVTGTWKCNSDTNADIITQEDLKGMKVMIVQCNTDTLSNLLFIPSKRGEKEFRKFGHVIETNFDLTHYWDCEHNHPLPRPDVKYGACTEMRTGDPAPWNQYHEKMLQWIEYHRLIGIEHFWIYVNEPYIGWEELPKMDYVTFIPFDYQVHNKHDVEIGAYDGHQHFFQNVQTNDCILRGKDLNVDWMALFDIDEYFQVMTSRSAAYPLRSFLKSVDRNSEEPIAGVEIRNVYFGQVLDNENENDMDAPSLVIGNKWRAPRNSVGRPKSIVHPRDVVIYGVHKVIEGSLPIQYLDYEKEVRMNHYKMPEGGVYDSYDKKGNLIRRKKPVKDESLLQQYGQRIKQVQKNYRLV